LTKRFFRNRAIVVCAWAIQITCTGAFAQTNTPAQSSPQANPAAAPEPAALPHRSTHSPLPPGAQAIRDLPYVPDSHNPAQTLDLFLPAAQQNKDKPLHLVVWIHGGGWSMGNKSMGPFFPLLMNGFAVASLNYRLTGEATFPAQIYDCKAAIRWLRAHGSEYNLDTAKIGVWGGSAGGHLVALLGTSSGVAALEGDLGNSKYSSDVQAVCDWYGPADLTTILAQSQQVNGGIPRPPSHGPVTKLLGGVDPEKAKAASPITYVTAKAPPFLIVHGDKDNVVPLAQSQELEQALKKVGVEVTLEVIPGGGHGGQGFSQEANKSVLDFFKKQLQ
jgi:acetyl esterase/lipase